MSQSSKISRTTTVYDHIKELQMRILASALILAAASFIAYIFYAQILTVLSSPLGAPLYYSSPAGSFTFVMKICFTAALIITIPVITYNVIMFVRPAFIKALPMKRIILTTLSSTILAMSGAAFAFFCILPGTLQFFKGFQVSGLSALISADNYLTFVTNIIIMFVILFQIPLVITFIDKVKPLQPKKLFKMEKWVILGSLVVALIAPFTYDLLTSLLIAIPIIVLYNLSIIIVLIRHSNERRKLKNATYATIAKPKARSELSVSELSFEGLADDLAILEKPKTVSIHNIVPNAAIMDVSRKSLQKETVKPAAWVEERKRQRAAINANVRVFSDIRRVSA